MSESWPAFAYHTLSSEQYAIFSEAHERSTEAARVCPFVEAVLAEPAAPLTPILGNVQSEEVRQFGRIAHHMRREPWWDGIPVGGRPRGEWRFRGAISLGDAITGEVGGQVSRCL